MTLEHLSTSVVAHRGQAIKQYKQGSRHNNTPHTTRQYIVDLCTEPQIPSKLLDSVDDNLSVSGMHAGRMNAHILKQNTNQKGLVTHAKSNKYDT
jgi:hypothetical protein